MGVNPKWLLLLLVPIAIGGGIYYKNWLDGENRKEVVKAIENRGGTLKLPIQWDGGKSIPAEAFEPVELIREAIKAASTTSEKLNIRDVKPVKLVPPAQFMYEIRVDVDGKPQNLVALARGPLEFKPIPGGRTWLRKPGTWTVEKLFAKPDDFTAWNQAKVLPYKQFKLDPSIPFTGRPAGQRELGSRQ